MIEDVEKDALHGDLNHLRPPSSNETFPLDGVELETVSDEELGQLFVTAPVLFQFGTSRIVRISSELVLKGAGSVSLGEAETQRFAAANGLRVPTVHRVFSITGMDPDWPEQETWFIVMDYISGSVLDQAWPNLTTESRESAASKVAVLINRMQSLKLNDLPPGPVGYKGDEPWAGPHFTAYGTGPFPTLKDMEDWYNHKLDVCIRFKQTSDETQRFDFKDMALTHQDIAPRNLIINDEDQDVYLIDWGMSGVYPVGFEQAALARQGPGKWDIEFRDMVLPKLEYQGDKERKQFRAVMYGLTTGAFL